MEQSGVPLVSGVPIRDLGEEPVTGATLQVTVAPDLGAPTVIALLATSVPTRDPS